jgi:hypothetical protein
MNELTPFYDVKMDGPDERVRQRYQEFLKSSQAAVELPGGVITKDMAATFAQENHGAIMNNALKKAMAPDAKASEAIKLAEFNAKLAGYTDDSQQQAKVIAPVQINLVVRTLNNKPEDDSVTIDSE